MLTTVSTVCTVIVAIQVFLVGAAIVLYVCGGQLIDSMGNTYTYT